MRFVIFLSVLFACVFPALAVEKHALTFDDFIALARISDPQISPDGKSLVYVVQTFSEKENKGTRKIWVVPADGGASRQLTFGTGNDSHPRFSPDGRTIAFISSRGGTDQIWLLPLQGGEARQLTELPTEASQCEWSPKGDRLSFFSSVYPDCSDDMSCNERKKKEEEERPSKVRIIDRPFYRHWNHWLGDRVSHLFVVPLEGGKAKDLTPGPYPVPPVTFLNEAYDLNFSPDGSEISFVGKLDEHPERSTNLDVFTVPVAGGEVKNLTAANQALDGGPLYSPDGRSIAYLAHRTPGYEADRYELRLYDRTTGRHRTLAPGEDYSVAEYAFAPDGGTIYFISEERGYSPLFSMRVSDGRIEKVVDKVCLRDLRLSRDGTFAVATNESFTEPPEVVRIELPGGKWRAVTHQNDGIMASIAMQPGEEITWEGAGGRKVHGFVMKPPFFREGEKYPLVVVLHGGPQGATKDAFHFRWNAEMFAAPGYVLFMPNFTGSTGYGSKFKEDISGDWGGKPYVDILTGVEKVCKLPYVDGTRVGAAGGSYGGYMINWIAGHTDRFKCLVSHAGLYDLASKYGTTDELWFPEWDVPGTPWGNREAYRRLSPSETVEHFATPMLVIHGENDFRVAMNQAQQLFAALQRRGVPSRLILFPDEDHFVQKPANARVWWREVQGWLGRYLK